VRWAEYAARMEEIKKSITKLMRKLHGKKKLEEIVIDGGIILE
jgi:hypothetical protein